MLTFRTITLADRPRIQAALRQSDFQGCEYSFSNNFAWYRSADSRIAFYEDFYIIAAFQTPDGIPLVTVPSGTGNWNALFAELEDTFCRNGQPLRFCGVTVETAAFLKQFFPAAVWKPERDSFDYLYYTADMITLPGKKYHKKRTHLRHFQKNFQSTFAPLTDADMEECIAFCAKQYNAKGGYTDASAVVEQFAIHQFFTHYRELELCGGVLRVDGKLVGVSLGEPLNGDTFVTHIEKADVRYPGSYTALAQAFTAAFAAEFRYLNREEDLGLEGLRQSKQSYQPCRLLEKGTMTINI